MRYSVYSQPLRKLVYESDNLIRAVNYAEENKSRCSRKFMIYDNSKKRFLTCVDMRELKKQIKDN